MDKVQHKMAVLGQVLQFSTKGRQLQKAADRLTLIIATIIDFELSLIVNEGVDGGSIFKPLKIYMQSPLCKMDIYPGV